MDPGWIFGATGFVFGAIGFWRGRRMDGRLQRMEGLLAERVRERPEAAARRVAEAEGLPEPAAGWGQTGQPWGQLPERQAAMLQLWGEGATIQEIAAAFGLSADTVQRELKQIRNQAVHGWHLIEEIRSAPPAPDDDA